MTVRWVYLNVADPLVAWLVYRGELFSPPPDVAGVLTVWHTSALRQHAVMASTSTSTPYLTEVAIEARRVARHPAEASRLRGFYVFGDRLTAERAGASWDGGFASHNLTAVEVTRSVRESRYDANWISRDFQAGPGPWVDGYLSGASRGDDSLWEHVVEGSADITDASLRNRAYDVVAATWPRSLGALELARSAKMLGSTLGRIYAFATTHSDGGVFIDYQMDFADATNAEFLERLGAYRRDPANAVHHRDFHPIDDVTVPDLRGAEFRVGPV